MHFTTVHARRRTSEPGGRNPRLEYLSGMNLLRLQFKEVSWLMQSRRELVLRSAEPILSRYVGR